MDGATVRDWLVAQVAARTGLDPSLVEADAQFSGYGLGSVELAEIGAGLEGFTERDVPPSLMFECRTIGEVAARLTEPLEDRARAPGPGVGAGEPVAIVGMACRVPGASDLEAFEALLESGTVAVSEVPAARWDRRALRGPPGASPEGLGSTWSAGLLEDVETFDAGFFAISADEARHMDPQQRLLLEACWEAFEDAGVVPADLRGSRTGVYVGISASDYGHRQLRDVGGIARFTSTGNALSVAANRLSYVFDLTGPSLAVDTACSSSLVAVHLAVQALRAGACERAVVAGVNLLLDPELTVALDRAGMLAPDGSCKPFDARAGGYVRGEGCAVALLEPRGSAESRKARVYALLLGSAANQDGATNGLTAPNPAAQRAVLQAAYRDAGVDASQVQYVECHGTGTPLGDPVEAAALGAVVGLGRDGGPCLIGSVKGNIGHLEAAAGIAGLVKTALAVYSGRIPASANYRDPNPRVAFADLGLAVCERTVDWPADPARRLAGVSSFGFGGTNVHVVLGGTDPEPAPAADGTVVLPLSARTATGLRRHLEAWAQRLARASEGEIGGLAYNAAVRSTHHRPFRVAVVADRGRSLAETVAALARSGDVPAGGAVAGAPRVAFVFAGQGCQWPGMARGLLASHPLFRSSILRSSEVLAGLLGWSILDVLRACDTRSLDRTDVAQPVLVAVELALARLWQSLGIEPAAVVGHSVGDVTAAVVAGVVDEADGLRLAARRGALMEACAVPGRMLAVGLPAAEAEEAAGRSGGSVHVAAVNGPRAAVLSGDGHALERIRAGLAARGAFARWVPVAYAFHSDRMQAAADGLASEFSALRGGEASIPLYSSVLGTRVAGSDIDGSYWGRSVRGTVRFAGAVEALLDQRVDALLEVGPHPVLRAPLRQLAAGRSPAPLVLHSLERAGDDHRAVAGAASRLYERGCAVKWDRLVTIERPCMSLPHYPWDRQRYWLARAPACTTAPAADGDLLGEPVDLAADGTWVWQSVVDPGSLPGLSDHRVSGETVLPASAVVGMVRAAATAAGVPRPAIKGLTLLHPLVLDLAPRTVQTTLVAAGDAWTVGVHSRSRDGGAGAWQLHATARVEQDDRSPLTGIDVAAVAERCGEDLSRAEFYDLLAQEGLAYGPAFRAVDGIRRRDGEAIATVGVEAAAWPGSQEIRLLDGAFQLVAAAAGPGAVTGRPMVPAGVETVRWDPGAGQPAYAQVTVRTAGDVVRADVRLVTEAGSGCAEVRGLRLRRRGSPAVPAPVPGIRFYEPRWRERPLAGHTAPARGAGPWLVVADRGGVAERLVPTLLASGVDAAVWDVHASPSLQSPLQGRTLAGVVHLGCLDGPVAAGVAATTGQDPLLSVLAVVRALGEHPGGGGRLLVASAGAQAAEGSDAVPSPFAAAAWGLLKAVPLENPLLRVSCVDLPPDCPDPAGVLLAEMAAEPADTEVAYRDGRRLVRRLVEAGSPAGERGRQLPVARADGTYLVTGGTGALGLHVARRLASLGAGRIVLLARGRERPGVQAAVSSVRRSGAEVRLVACDVRDRPRLARALGRLRAEGPPLRGVVHAAGVVEDRPLPDLTVDVLRAVLEPKVFGGWYLHELTADDPLDWFVLFSSAAGVLGSPGQAAYSAANAFLDALAHHRRARGRPGQAIDWGPWSGPGMWGQASGGDRLRTAISTIDPDQGLAVLERLVAEGRTQTLVLPFDLRDLVRFYPPTTGASFFEEIAGADARLAAGVPLDGPARAVRPNLRTEFIPPATPVERRIAAIWERAIGIEPVGLHDSFFDLGGDSVFANQILVEIGRLLGVTIPPERAFERFTVAGLAALAEEQMQQVLAVLTEGETEELLRATAPDDAAGAV